MSITTDEDEFKDVPRDALIDEIRHLRAELHEEWGRQQSADWEKARAHEANRTYDSKIRMIWGAIAFLLLVMAYLLHSDAVNIRWGILVTLVAAIAAATKASTY